MARSEEAAMAPTTTPAAGPAGLFGRLFPPAPPLPGKGDPLKGFTYRGRFQGIVSGAWLIFRHPLAWGAPAAGWAVLQLVLLLFARQSLVAFGITLAQYALLIGAGWFAWWRPWAFGLAAGVFGTLLYALLAGIVTLQAGETPEAALAVAAGLSTLLVLYALVGAFAGFYCGYLRRRMASPVPANGKRR